MSWRGEECWMFPAESVCLFVCVCVFVCQRDNFGTSKRRMIKLGGRCIVQKSPPCSNLGVIAPGGAQTQTCGVRIRRWENQRRLSNVVLRTMTLSKKPGSLCKSFTYLHVLAGRWRECSTTDGQRACCPNTSQLKQILRCNYYYYAVNSRDLLQARRQTGLLG